jgi:AAA15 family ATPase/GTPase
MFKKIGIKNFRTHKDSIIELSDVTLLIGSNNSGKSNFLAGIHYFSRLINVFNPDRRNPTYDLKSYNYFSQKHSLSKDDEPICFNCEWGNNDVAIKYNLSIFPDTDALQTILCTEELFITGRNSSKSYSQGFKSKSSQLSLRKIAQRENGEFDDEIHDFFQDISSFYYYNFQPSFLKGEGVPTILVNGKREVYEKKDYLNEYRNQNRHPNIPYELGKEGANLQEILLYIKEYEAETYNRFFGYLKRFVKNFNGLIVKDGEIRWQFDMGGSNFPFYEPEKISDGLVKAAAIALLCSLRRPPALLLLEEVENGINQRKLSEFLSWLTHASDDSKKTQFIISSHSPSVIREFSNKLDTVYNIHLRERDYVSRITNLNEAIKPLVNMGTIQEESIITKNGKDVIQIRPYELVELFYNGVLGEL